MILLCAQVLAQLNEEQLQMLFDVCCVWIWLLPKLESTFNATAVSKCREMFDKGKLGKQKAWIKRIRKYQAQIYLVNLLKIKTNLARAKSIWASGDWLATAEKLYHFVIGFPETPSHFPTRTWPQPSSSQSPSDNGSQLQ